MGWNCQPINLLYEVCNNVAIEFHLQPLSGETIQYKTADGAKLNIAANGCWHGEQDMRG